MTDNVLNAILQDLAAGRIDATQAAALIGALPGTDQAEQAAGPASTDQQEASTPAGGTPAAGSQEAGSSAGETQEADFAASGTEDAPQWSTYTPPPAARQFSTFVKDTLRNAGRQARPQPSAGPQRTAPTAGLAQVVVHATGRRVRVIGDPSVASVLVEGPHVLRREGSRIDISSDGNPRPTLEGFSVFKPPAAEDLRGVRLGKEVLIRVNPELPIDCEVTAGSLSTERVPRLGRIRVTAGGADLRDVTEISDALIQAGAARVSGPISVGRSRIRVESGSATITLSEDANVMVRAESQFGGVSWPGEGHFDEFVVGTGAARLDVAVVMGHVSIRLAAGQEEQS